MVVENTFLLDLHSFQTDEFEVSRSCSCLQLCNDFTTVGVWWRRLIKLDPIVVLWSGDRRLVTVLMTFIR